MNRTTRFFKKDDHQPRKIKKKLILASGVFTLVLASFFILEKTGAISSLSTWIRGRLIEVYLHRIAPHLPFKIEKISAQANWRDFLEGRIQNLSIQLQWNPYRVHIQGPIEISQDSHKKAFLIQYAPQITFWPAEHGASLEKLAMAQKSSPIPFQLTLIGRRTLTELLGFSLTSKTPTLSIPWLGLQSKDFQFSAVWHPTQSAKAAFQFKELEWKPHLLSPLETEREDTLHLTDASFKAKTLFPIDLTSDQALNQVLHTWKGPAVSFKLDLKTAETLWGGMYLDLPVQSFFLQGGLQIYPEPKVEIVLKHPPEKEARLTAMLHTQTQIHLKWNIPPWKVSHLAQIFFNTTRSAGGAFASMSSPFQKIELIHGTVQSQGEISFPFNSPQALQMQGSADLKDLTLKWPSKMLAIKNFNFNAPFSSRKGLQGTLSIDEIFYRRFQAKLSPTQVSVIPDPKFTSYALKIAPQSLAHSSAQSGTLPLHIEGVPLRIGTAVGTLGGQASPSHLQVQTSFFLPQQATAPILHRLCLDEQDEENIPAAQLRVHFPKISLTENAIDVTGDLHVETLGGKIDVDEMGLFDLDTTVPELDFNLDFYGFHLQQLGEWAGFGEMDGVLHGYAHDVTFQSWLPTQFDLHVEAQPFKHKKVVFSPEAMKSFIQVFAGEDIQHLPGFADWLAFGLPMKIRGGYDVDYAGLNLTSKDGVILLETLDSEEVKKKDPGHHYLLHGKNFRMPLRSSRYPLIVDATSMSNFVRGMAVQMSHLNQAKTQTEEARKLKKEKKYELREKCFSPDF